jgi:predicted outer membrane repeat protein
MAALLGGGIHVDSGGSATIDGSRFSDNSVTTRFDNMVPAGGGAIALIAGTSSTITSSEFSGNKAIGRIGNGGAINTGGTLIVFDTTLRQKQRERSPIGWRHLHIGWLDEPQAHHRQQ